MDMPAGAFFARCRLGEEARAQAHRGRDIFDRQLGERRVIGGAKGGPSPEVDFEQTGAGFRMHRGQLDAQSFEGGHQSAEESVESAKLAQAVAQPARERLRLAIPKPQLILDRRDRLIAELGKTGQNPAKDLA